MSHTEFKISFLESSLNSLEVRHFDGDDSLLGAEVTVGVRLPGIVVLQTGIDHDMNHLRDDIRDLLRFSPSFLFVGQNRLI